MINRIARALARRAILWGRRISGENLTDGESIEPPEWATSIFQWFLVALVAPFAVWIACVTLPERWVIDAASVADQIVWSHLKETKLHACGPVCRDVAFGMIIAPIVWIMLIIGGIRFYLIAGRARDWNLAELRRQGISTSVEPKIDHLVDIFKKYPLIGTVSLAALLFLLIQMTYLPVGQVTTNLGRGPIRAVTGYQFAFLSFFAVSTSCIWGSAAYCLGRIWRSPETRA